MANVFSSSPIDKQPPRVNAQRVMTVSELSSYMRIHRTTIYRLLKGGEIPGAFRIGSDWRFNREEIDRWRLGLKAVTPMK